MAANKKRKREEDEPTESSLSIGTARPSKWSKSKRARSARSTSDRLGLLKTLPAELRNHIYELALDVQGLGESTTFLRPRRSGMRSYLKIPRWKEPGLLRVAKWVRAEAAAIYYETVTFGMRLQPADFHDFCNFMLVVEERRDASSIDNRERLSLRFHETTRKTIHDWLPLARLAQSTSCSSLSAAGFINKIRQTPPKRYCSRSLGNVRVLCSDVNIYAGLMEVIALGLRAREHQWTSDRLTREFQSWVASLSSGPRTQSSDIRRAFSRGVMKRRYWKE